MTVVAVQMVGLISMARDFGVRLTGVVKSDSSTAVGMAHRDDLGGRCIQIKGQYLWVQSKMKDGEFKMEKILWTNNLADAMTKALDLWTLAKYLHGSDELYCDVGSCGARLVLIGIVGVYSSMMLWK